MDRDGDTMKGYGTIFSPYEVRTLEDLISIDQDYDGEGTFKLMNDIWVRRNDARVMLIDEFYGHFDGQGKTIVFDFESIAWNHPYISDGRWHHMGLIFHITSGAEIIDLHINAESGWAFGQTATEGGLLAARNSGAIRNCSCEGQIHGRTIVGGLIGSNWGGLQDCSSSANVSGKEYIGGLVGVNYTSGTITNSYTTGNVIGRDAVGRITGTNIGLIRTCHATGKVYGKTRVGSITGDPRGAEVGPQHNIIIKGE